MFFTRAFRAGRCDIISLVHDMTASDSHGD